MKKLMLSLLVTIAMLACGYHNSPSSYKLLSSRMEMLRVSIVKKIVQEQSTSRLFVDAAEMEQKKILQQQAQIEHDSIPLNTNHPLCDISKQFHIHAFYPNWTCDNTTTSAMICMWKGVTCYNGVVGKLVLSNLGLTGSIPVSLSSLQYLEYLDLSHNKLTSSIPSFIINFPLAYLDLSHNYLTSSIPTNIGVITKLKYLDLSYNTLSSSIPASIGGLPYLGYLDLSSNSLRYSIPSSIGNVHYLAYLALSNNKLTSSIPGGIWNLTGLAYLQLRSNQLNSSLPTSIGNLAKLAFLDLFRNQFTSSLPSAIGKLNSLQAINLQINKFTSSLPDSFFTLSKLVSITAGNNKFTGAIIPDAIANMKSLIFISVTDCRFSSPISSAIGQLSSLYLLNVYSNRIRSTIPTSVCLLSKLISIVSGSNRLSGTIPTCMGILTSLKLISLSTNSLTGVIPSSLGAMLHLESVCFRRNRLTSTVPSSLTQLTSIQKFMLSDNHLTGTIDARMCQLPKLFLFQLKNNLLNCQPACQSDGVWNANATLPRCPDGQDVALYDLETSLNVVAAQASKVLSTTGYRYFTGNEYTQIIALDYPNAFAYHIQGQFTFGLGSTVTICFDPGCQRILVQVCNIPRTCSFVPGVSVQYSIDYSIPYGVCYIVIHNVSPFPGSFPIIVKTRSHLPSSWAFNPSSNGIVEAKRLCQDLWTGVMCDNGNVAALDLRGYALKGTLPASIGLLSALTSLDLSYNQITGSIVSTLGSLIHLDTLVITGNKLKGGIPEQLSNLSLLYFVDMSYNFLSGSIPTVLYKLPALSFSLVDGNAFEGEIPAGMCEKAVSTNATFTLTGNPHLTCYQEECWSTSSPSLRRVDGTLRMCSPTTSPSSPPTPSPSQMPMSPTDNTTNQGLIVGVSIGGVLLVLMLISIGLYFTVYVKHFSKEAEEEKSIQRRLQELPIHRALIYLRNETEAELLSIIDANISLAGERDMNGRTALEVILSEKKQVSHNVVHRLLVQCLPFDVSSGDGGESKDSTGQAISDTDKVQIWVQAVQSNEDNVMTAVEMVLFENKKNILMMSNACDIAGRKCIDIASTRCKAVMYRIMNLHERYEIKEGPPEHKSSTSLVIFAIDHGDPSELPRLHTRNVALKFMRHRDQFQNEIQYRRTVLLDANFVIPILQMYGEESTAFREDAIAKGYSDYPFCIVMEAANSSLKRVIDQQYIAGNAWHIIRSIVEQLTSCLLYLHNKKLVHGDLKPLNVLQTQIRLKLIDFDASVKQGEFIGRKYSSCYIPPEMIAVDSEGKYVIRALTTSPGHSSYELLPAAPSFDIWGLGCVVYLLCTGSNLFSGNVEDNICDQNVLGELYEWSDSLKERKLGTVTNRTARNLLSILLNNDPGKRPNANRVLSHPFLTGMMPSRLPGEKAVWDVFISYRVESDEYHAEVLYDECKKHGLKVWLDSKCLQAGQNWLVEFARALVGSSIVICILSRGAINHRTKDTQNFGKLKGESPCDNLLLEWRLTLEAKKRGMIEAILPVLVGDMDTNAVYNNYLKSDCGPTAVVDVVVGSVELALRESLEREGLGSPFEENLTAKAIHAAILSNQAKFIEGDFQTCAAAIVKKLHDIKSSIFNQGIQKYKESTKNNSAFPVKDDGFRTKVMQLMVEENQALKEEIRMLKEKLLPKP